MVDIRSPLTEHFADLAWHYEKQPPNGGAPGDAYTQSLNGTGFDLAQLVAREAIQNSVDAWDPAMEGGVVMVDFRIRELEGEQRATFEAAARLDDMRARFPSIALDGTCCIARRDGPLRLLYVEDYNTTGLAGDPTRNDSNFRKLLMNIGLSDKTLGDLESGGSYGLGKSVYSGNSAIQTIFAFSRTRDADGNPTTMLMGCAYQRHHEHEGAAWTGRAWLGRHVALEGEGYRMDPFVGEEAESRATALGFEREQHDFGTSILIIDTDLKAEDVIRGVEDYWWPRIVEHELQVDVIDQNGNRFAPQPMQRRHLKPFIDAWNVVIQRSPPTQGQDRRQFNKYGDKHMGAVGIVTLEVDEEGRSVLEDDEGEYETRIDSIALIRSPKMVVAYHRGWNPGRPPVVGAFMASREIDRILKLSEPPAHDKWDRGALRLKGVGDGAEIVKSLHQRIKSRVKEFQKKVRPPEPKRPKKLVQLERELSKWLGSGKKSGPKPDRPETPISLRWPNGVTIRPAGTDALEAFGDVVASIDKNEEGLSTLPVIVSFTCLIVEEGSATQASAHPVEVEVEHDGPVVRGEGPSFRLTLRKESQTRFFVRTAPYDQRWTIKLVPEVKPDETTPEAEGAAA